MKNLVTEIATHGPFTTVEELEDCYLCDGVVYAVSVVGKGAIEDYTPPPHVVTAAERAEVLAKINIWRAQANQSTFTHLGKVIACDALSRSDIDAVAGSIALKSAFPAGFPGAWKAVDNSYFLLPNVAAFVAMYDSMTAQGTANFTHSQALKAAVAAATTTEQLNAIVWGQP